MIVVSQDSLDLMFDDERQRDRWLAAFRWALCLYPPDHPLAAQAAAQDSSSDASPSASGDEAGAGGGGGGGGGGARTADRESPAVQIVGSPGAPEPAQSPSATQWSLLVGVGNGAKRTTGGSCAPRVPSGNLLDL